jgi:hypothetical protein
MASGPTAVSLKHLRIDLASTLTAEQSRRLTESVLGEVIEKALGQVERPKSGP